MHYEYHQDGRCNMVRFWCRGAKVNRLGMGLYASSCDNIWPGLLALQPAAVVAIDPYHLPPALGTRPYWLWRPWVPGTMRDYRPREWLERVYREWVAKGRHPFDGIQFLNEPNLPTESGYDDPAAAVAAANSWGLELLPRLRELWPNADMHSPPLSPNYGDWVTFYQRLRPLIAACDVLNVHTYLDKQRSYEIPAAMYPDMPLVISECGTGAGGTAEYARQLLAWEKTLPAYVNWAAIYIYNSTAGQHPAWEICGTAAERVLIAEG